MGAWENLQRIGAEAEAEDVVSVFLRDPVVAYVGLTVAGAREPNPGVVVELNGTRIRLPQWTPAEWEWWSSLGVQIAGRVKAAASDDDKRRIERAGARAIAPVKRVVKDGDTSPAAVAALYDRMVRLVIEAAASDFAKRNRSGFLELVKAALLESLRDIPPAIGAAVARARDVITGVAQASAELLGKVFGAVLRGAGSGLGIGGAGLVLLLAGLWYVTRNHKE